MLFERERGVNHKIGKVSIGKVRNEVGWGRLNVVAKRGRLGRKMGVIYGRKLVNT